VHRREGPARPAAMLLTVLLTALVASACTGTGGARATSSSPKTIPQPPLGSLSKLTRRRLVPDEQRIDLVVPSPPVEVNLGRFELWTRRLLVDAAARNAAAVHGDVTTLAWIRDRIALDDADGNGIDDQLRYLRSVAEAREFRVAMVQAARLRETLEGLNATP
jgi:hypothetical protein